MGPIRRAVARIAGWLPVPGPMSDEPPAVDPRVDPDALEAFGREQLAQFGPGQQHAGGAPLPGTYGTDRAREAREQHPAPPTDD